MRYQLSAPTIVHDPTRRRFLIPVRIVLQFIGANDFMQLSISLAHGATFYLRSEGLRETSVQADSSWAAAWQA